MLRVSRSDIDSYAARWKLKWADDQSNMDDHYPRVRIRQTILPAIREKFPDVDSKLNLIADDMLRVVNRLKGETGEK
jgi:tRNA(Ile)-lysidine synthase